MVTKVTLGFSFFLLEIIWVDGFRRMPFRKSSYTSHEYFDGEHRFEHWYRDNSLYFITSRCRDKFPAFESEQAKLIFWDRFDFYSEMHGFVPCVTSLMNNHYHSLGYLKVGEQLGPMMRKLDGSVAKLVNDTLSKRHLPFWRREGNQDYFDGCIRSEKQFRRAYRYTLLQSERHRICKNYHDYAHTQVRVDVEVAVKRALELDAYMKGVPYKRYRKDR